MNRILYVVLSFCLVFEVFGQFDMSEFRRLEVSGPIPPEFTEFFTTKYMEAKSTISVDARRKHKKREDEFHKNSQYFIDELFTSGKVIYGDPVTNYVQRVLDYVLDVYGPVDKDIRVFTVRSPVFNAAATNDGVLLVNLGLLAQVENEAQLAFILSHEIIHSLEDHALDGFLEKFKIERGESYYRGQNSDDKLVSMSNYSKSHEFEADLEGFDRIFKKSAYDPQEAVRVLDVMLYSYLPFDEISFSKDFFYGNETQLSDELFLSEVKGITAYEDYDDTRSTHPNLKARREALEGVLAKTTHQKGKLFVVDEDEFFRVQDLARFEISRSYLTDRKYPEAIYNSFLLLQKYPDNQFLRTNVGLALHTFSTYKNNKSTKFMGKVDDVEGNIQSLYHFLDNIDPLDLNVLSVSYNYRNHRDFPNEPFLEELFEKSLHELIFFHEIKPNYFAQERPAEEEEGEEEEKEDEELRRGRSSKIATLKKQKRIQEHINTFAFVDLFGEDSFKNPFDEKIAALKEAMDKEDYFSWRDQRMGKKRTDFRLEFMRSRENAKKKKKEFENIEKVVLVTPRYLKINQGTMWTDFKPKIKFEETDQELRVLRDDIVHMVNLAGIESEVLDYKVLEESDVDKFNDLIFIKDWLNEYWKHPRVENIVSTSEHADAFIEKYGTQYVLLTGTLTYRKTNAISGSTIWYGGLGILFPPLLVPAIIDAITPVGNAYYYVLLVDVKQGYTRFKRVDILEGKILKDFIRATVYDNILEISKL